MPEYSDLNFSSNCLISSLRRYFIYWFIEPVSFQLSPYLLNLSIFSFKNPLFSKLRKLLSVDRIYWALLKQLILFIVLHPQIADSHIDVGQCVCWVVLYCYRVAFNCLFILVSVFINIAQIIESITVPRINFSRFDIPFDCCIHFFLVFIANCHIVVSCMINRFQLNAFGVILDGQVIILILIIGDCQRIVNSIIVLAQLQSLLIPIDRFIDFLLVIVG